MTKKELETKKGLEAKNAELKEKVDTLKSALVECCEGKYELQRARDLWKRSALRYQEIAQAMAEMSLRSVGRRASSVGDAKFL